MSRTRFDVSRRADWWPAFSRSVAAPQDSVQPTTLQYTVSPTIATDTALLQDKLEKTLRDSITKWRPTTRLKFFTFTAENISKNNIYSGGYTNNKWHLWIFERNLVFYFLSQDNRHSLCQSLNIKFTQFSISYLKFTVCVL